MTPTTIPRAPFLRSAENRATEAPAAEERPAENRARRRRAAGALAPGTAVGAAAIWIGSLALAACGSTGDGAVLFEPWIEGPGPRRPAFLAFSSRYDGVGPAPVDAPGFPQRLSEAGVFADLARLEPLSGILPYEIQAPLWSDGALKQRWLSVPAGATLGYADDGAFDIPAGTVIVKHFEMALDERSPEVRRRLETRFWVAARPDAQYGVTYKWNAEQTDAELLVASEVEDLEIVGADGEVRRQSYFYPGPGDCGTCHSAAAGYVLGLRAAQLNRTMRYRPDRPPIDQLVAWSSWGWLDRHIDGVASARAPRLAALDDEAASLEERVRSYWEGNCAMCHAGQAGSVPGWDARYASPLDELGLGEAPQNPSSPASRLIEPGSPDDSLIYLRGNATESPMRMPPVGRSRADEAYLDVLRRWIASLEAAP